MNTRLLLGLHRWMAPVPPWVWRWQVNAEARKRLSSLAFMTPDHHRVRDLAVLALPRVGAPLAPRWFSQTLDLPLERTIQILDELEAGLTFLYRNPEGSVTWAYPVTIDKTPHQVTCSSGKRISAA